LNFYGAFSIIVVRELFCTVISFGSVLHFFVKMIDGGRKKSLIGRWKNHKLLGFFFLTFFFQETV